MSSTDILTYPPLSRINFITSLAYLLLCLFFLNLFLRLWVAILWPFLFFPLGIAINLFYMLLLYGYSSTDCLKFYRCLSFALQSFWLV